ncbi:hypothetical protein SAMN05216564_1196 [Halopenitus persicus]|uniref:Uncharacterized protein n=1 Tax=Halopenitus persicus TaxID=1048396 RepID=A0A1H3P3U9_9EURY|nr:hypothetical protein SAMN05216564_1196 [Halopenitus persicus]
MCFVCSNTQYKWALSGQMKKTTNVFDGHTVEKHDSVISIGVCLFDKIFLSLLVFLAWD